MISVEVVIPTINIEVSLTGAVSSTVVCLDADAELRNTANTLISTTAIPSGTKGIITAPDASIENSDTSYNASAVSGGTFVLPDIDFTDSDNVTTQVPAQTNIVATPQIKTLTWELNYNGTDDVIFIPCTVSNEGTLASGSGSNVGTITVSTDGISFGALSFPFSVTNGTTYFFKRSTATISGVYTMVGTYV